MNWNVRPVQGQIYKKEMVLAFQHSYWRDRKKKNHMEISSRQSAWKLYLGEWSNWKKKIVVIGTELMYCLWPSSNQSVPFSVHIEPQEANLCRLLTQSCLPAGFRLGLAHRRQRKRIPGVVGAENGPGIFSLLPTVTVSFHDYNSHYHLPSSLFQASLNSYKLYSPFFFQPLRGSKFPNTIILLFITPSFLSFLFFFFFLSP